jgi:protein-L-isoaspartate(D-aspartate) O-methyltransferase
MNKQVLIKTLIAEGIKSEKILKAIEEVPREIFVPESSQFEAYENYPLPIGHQQTISQPYIVAKMTEILLAKPIRKILEIGTGSGYQAAILSQLVEEVYTVERILPLFEKAKEKFQQLNYTNIRTLFGDGFLGWKEFAPYDAIIVTAATPIVPPVLIAQLKDQGRLLLPVGQTWEGQQLQLIMREGKTFHTEIFDPVSFVPLLKGTEK